MTIDRFKLIIGTGLAACAFGAVPATASAADTAADQGPCISKYCPIDIAIAVLRLVDREYEEAQELYRAVEDDLNAYLCQQTGEPTYCNH